MSQNDFTIANQTFPNTRADINSALQALASNSSGSSTPSTTFANQFFYNTSSNLLQMLNEDNDGLITICELDQVNDTVEYFKADAIRLLKVEYLDGDDAIIVNDGGGIICPGGVDLTATELILDGDNDTTITANVDDQIDFKIGGTDKVVMTGSVITMVGTTTNTMSLEVGTGRSGDGTSLIDLVGDATYGDFGARLIRNAGANSATELVHRGTGQIAIVAFDAAPVTFKVSNAEKMRVHSDGNVGIGTTSPGAKLDIAGNIRLSAGSPVIELNNGGPQLFAPAANTLGFATGGGIGSATERARIDSSGTVLLGQTTNPATATLVLKVPTGSGNGVNAQITSNTGTSFPWSNYNASGAYVGGISCTSSSTAFPTSSDYRLKENVSYSFDATTRLKQLKPCRFNFKIDTDNTVDGFLAHEVSSIVPEAVIGEKDATKDLGTIKDADDNIISKNIVESAREDGQTWEKTSTENDYQGIDQSKLVPLLVKTIQELEARITALEG